MQQDGDDTINLAAALPTLASSRKVRAFLREKLSEEEFRAALRLMRAASIDGDLGATVHDLLVDEIERAASTAWSGFTRSQDDEFPACVMRYGGVHFVSVMQYDCVGYFLDREDAVAYLLANWERVQKR